MSKHKNLLMIFVSIILLTYAALLSVYPAVLNMTFNIPKFQEKVKTATGLNTTLGRINFTMKPDLTLIITIKNWSSKYVDYQDCFDADTIELKTGALSPITKSFPIKELNLKHVKFSDQLLPEGVNKLAYLTYSFEASAFGAKKIKIGAGPVKVYDFKIKRIAPRFYKEDNRLKETYSKSQVRGFLKDLNIRYVEIN